MPAREKLPENSRAIGVSFTPSDGPRDPSLVAEAVLAFLEATALKHRSMTVLQAKSLRPRFSEEAFRRAFDDGSTREVWLWTDDVYDGAEIRCFLRPHHPADQTYELRFLSVVSNRLAVQVTVALRALLEVFAEQYPMVHGSIGGYRTAQYAAQECSFSGSVRVDDMDVETKSRLGTDDLYYNVSKRMLRRLYPVTIIGAELWAKLPPLPETSAAVTVEDLGNCKMLTCWPELVEPHDPAFLKGTKELRRWIWPHTIQNPADDPEVVDRKLGLE
jgi:hypothetical protein